MRTIKLFLLFIIVALLTMAYYSLPPDQRTLPEELNQKLVNFQTQIKDQFPQLTDEVAALIKTIKDNAESSPPAEATEKEIETGSTNNIESSESQKEESTEEQPTKDKIHNKVQEMLDKLKEINATELTDSLKNIYSDLETHKQETTKSDS